MKTTRASISRIAITFLGLAFALLIAVSISVGQTVKKPKGKVQDWTNHHLIFSNPGTKEKAIQEGQYDRWLKIVNDPRYTQQQDRRSSLANALPEASSAQPAVAATQEPDSAAGATGMTLEQREASQLANGRLPFGLMKALIPPTGNSDAGPKVTKRKNRLKKDWSETLGATSGTVGFAGGTTGLGQFPATYTTGSTSCNDFAVYNTGLASSSSQAAIVAYNNLYASCNGGVPTVYWAYNPGTLAGTSSTITNSVILYVDGGQVAFVQYVPAATAASGTLTANTGSVPTSGSTVTVGSITYTWTTTASPTTANQMSTSGITLETEISQTMYAALTGSRANCPSSNTTCIGTGTVANTSVTASVSGETVTVTASCGVGSCGNNIVFTQSSTATGMNISPTTGKLSPGVGTTGGFYGAQLVVLKWAPGGTLTSPTTLTSNSSYPNCTAPCMIAVPFSGNPTDTYSSPYYDNGSDTIYVGDDAGNLHQFTNVFNESGLGTPPAENTTSPWPVAVNTAASLGSPVYDSVSGNVFVGDYAPLTSIQGCQLFATPNTCGYLYSVNSSGTVVKSAQLDYNYGVLDSPIVDSTTGYVYAFVGDDGSANCSSGPCAGVFQFSTGFAANAMGTEAAVGPGYEFMLSGAFDNLYYTSSVGTGNLYVVGNTGPADNTLYQIPITANTMGTPVAGPEVATNYDNDYYSGGLQVTEFFDTSAPAMDYIFLSVLAFGNPAQGCTGGSFDVGCVMGYNVTVPATFSASTASTGALPEEGGTSGIVVDNGSAGAQNIYFSTLLNQTCTTSGGTNGCAVQTSQTAP